MDHQRVFVKVVGFTDVERHALNTVFRLSEHRDPAYAPWIEGVQGMPAAPEILLVDGESAEAVLTHVRELPAGQRLIWVGPGAPAHAWRVLSRPIQWAILLTDLDAMFAARLADSGYVDLDISTPVPLDATAGAPAMSVGCWSVRMGRIVSDWRTGWAPRASSRSTRPPVPMRRWITDCP